MNEKSMNKALEMYKNQEVSLWKASEIAGASLIQMLYELQRLNIAFQYDLEELKEDIKYSRSM